MIGEPAGGMPEVSQRALARSRSSAPVAHQVILSDNRRSKAMASDVNRAVPEALEVSGVPPSDYEPPLLALFPHEKRAAPIEMQPRTDWIASMNFLYGDHRVNVCGISPPTRMMRRNKRAIAGVIRPQARS